MSNTPKTPHIENEDQEYAQISGLNADLDLDITKCYFESRLRPGGDVYEAIKGSGKFVIKAEQDVVITGIHTARELHGGDLGGAGENPTHVDGPLVIKAGRPLEISGQHIVITPTVTGSHNGPLALSVNGVPIVISPEGVVIDLPNTTQPPSPDQQEIPFDADTTLAWEGQPDSKASTKSP